METGLTRLIERLEREGLVQRRQDRADSRNVYAAITEHGLERLAEATTSHSDHLELGVQNRCTKPIPAAPCGAKRHGPRPTAKGRY
jgi:DNA-binding MarR family transcriptional regulator